MIASVRRGARSSARPDAGQATVELALVLPVVVMLVLAIVQFATVGRDELLVVHAAREAARAASVGGNGIEAATRLLPGAQVQITGGARVGDPVAAIVRYHALTNFPLVGALIPDPWLQATVVMRAERPR